MSLRHFLRAADGSSSTCTKNTTTLRHAQGRAPETHRQR